MIDFLRNILVSVTIVAIFSGIVLKISENNEIVKLGCSMLMIFALIVPFKNNINFDDLLFSEKLDEYKTITNDALKNSVSLENTVISNNLEKYVYNELEIDCRIELGEDKTIAKVIVYENVNFNKLAEVLGITNDQIEYIKSR